MTLVYPNKMGTCSVGYVNQWGFIRIHATFVSSGQNLDTVRNISRESRLSNNKVYTIPNGCCITFGLEVNPHRMGLTLI